MNPPQSFDQPEISLLGPGYGESIVLHLGRNSWVIVDSCIDSDTKQVASLQYLQSLGVDPATSVTQVIATHWHDDHIRGLAKTLEACHSAEFVCSGALKVDEFLTLVSAFGKRSLMETSGVTEFFNILKILESRALFGSSTPIKFAIADRCLFRGTFSWGGLNTSCEIRALSPSDRLFILAQRKIAELLPEANKPKFRLPAFQSNHSSVALLVRIGEQYIILGADLEEENNPGQGWTAVLNSYKPQQLKAEIYKVPHHGSKNADNPSIWLDLLTENPWAILSPFLLGDVELPTKEDVRRISGLTDRAYLTAPPRRRSIGRRPHAVERQIQGFVKNRRRLDVPLGQVRLRGVPNNGNFSWSVDLKGAAIDIAKAYPLN